MKSLPAPPPSAKSGRARGPQGTIRLLDPRTEGAECIVVNVGQLPASLTIRIAGVPYRPGALQLLRRYQALLLEDEDGNLYLSNVSLGAVGWGRGLGVDGTGVRGQHAAAAPLTRMRSCRLA